jgi:hypothetical protein
LLALLAPIASSQSDEPGDFQSEHHAASVDLVKGMLHLAEWCNDKELFLERDRLYRAVIDIDPNNPDARKGLRYSRKSDGSWQEPAPREAKNRNAKALAVQLPAKRAAVAEPYEKRMVAAFAAYNVDEAMKHSVYAEILLADPEDALVHTALGESLLDGTWVLGETVTGKQRRADIKAAAQAALDDVGEMKQAPLTEVERGLDIKWTQALLAKHVRVLGTVPPAEAQQIAKQCEAAGRFFRAVMDADTLHRDNFTIYDLGTVKDGQTLADTLPGVDPEFRKSLKGCVGAMIAGQPVVAQWDKDPLRRIDGASRQTFSDFFSRAYGLTLQPGWAWEGMSLYLNGELAGTRLTWFIPMTPTEAGLKALQKKLLAPSTDWMVEAKAMLDAPDHPKLADVLQKGVDAMTVKDLLYAYAFSAYLIEGRPGDVVGILRRISGNKSPTADVLASVFHMDMDTLEARVDRWLAERH